MCDPPRNDETPVPALVSHRLSDAELQSQSSLVSSTSGVAVPDTDRPLPWDVFVSHRGPDTKMGFVDALQRHMQARRVFVDRFGLQPGQRNWDTIRCRCSRRPQYLAASCY